MDNKGTVKFCIVAQDKREFFPGPELMIYPETFTLCNEDTINGKTIKRNITFNLIIYLERSGEAQILAQYPTWGVTTAVYSDLRKAIEESTTRPVVFELPPYSG